MLTCLSSLRAGGWRSAQDFISRDFNCATFVVPCAVPWLVVVHHGRRRAMYIGLLNCQYFHGTLRLGFWLTLLNKSRLTLGCTVFLIKFRIHMQEKPPQVSRNRQLFQYYRPNSANSNIFGWDNAEHTAICTAVSPLMSHRGNCYIMQLTLPYNHVTRTSKRTLVIQQLRHFRNCNSPNQSLHVQ